LIKTFYEFISYFLSLLNTGDYLPEEKTEVIYGAENIIKINNELWSELKEYADICADKNIPYSYTAIPQVAVAFRKLQTRGIKVRIITEITADNIEYCKELLRLCELRHLDEIKGNFGIGDGIYYRASAKSTEIAPPPLLICSTLRALAEQQQYFFDMLWRKAIPAKRRIKELEEGLKREFIETIQDPKETLDLIPKLVSSSTEEIQLIISNKEAYQLFENEIKLTSLLREQIKEGNHIQVLIHGEQDKKTDRSINLEDQFHNLYNLQSNYPERLEIQRNTSDIYERLNVFISDRETIVIIESKKSVKDRIISGAGQFDLLGLATYSNSESTVSSYATIFDRLWIRSGIVIDD
jgi:two-component system, OmpR family, sensor histidine kinase VicK